MVIGKVQKIDSNGETQRLRRSHSIQAGDTIKTLSNGQAQIRMTDGGIISIRPASEFKIAAYDYAQNNTADQAVFKLIKGGMRAVTGTIGKQNTKRVKYETGVATLGIRGTDFTASLCGKTCVQQNKGKTGLFAGVVSGGISMKNAAGRINISAGKFAHSTNSNSAPVAIEKPPAALNFPKQYTIKGASKASYASPTEEMVDIGFRLTPELKDSIVRQARDLGISLNRLIESAKSNGIDPVDILKPLLQAGTSPQRVINTLLKSYPGRSEQILLAAFSTGDERINKIVESIAEESGTDTQKIKDVKAISNLITTPNTLTGSTGANNTEGEVNEIDRTPSRALIDDTPLLDPTLIPESSTTGDGTAVSPS